MDPTSHAQALIDEWHARLKAGGPARPSPTIATAMTAEYERLDVYCDGCRHKAMIPWRLIGRPIVTPLADLAGSFTCQRCGPKGPLPKILGVSRKAEAVWPVDEQDG
jgi:hypothetical protein